MYNYRITQLSCRGAFRWCFCAGACLGGLGGIMLGLLERSVVGIFGGMFLGLFFGLCCALAGLVFAAILNILSPITGGLPIRLEPLATKEIAGDEPPAISNEEPVTGPIAIQSPGSQQQPG